MCGDELGGAPPQRGQDSPRRPARGHGVILPRHLLRGVLPQDPRPRVRPPPRLLPQERLEHYGLRRRSHRVGAGVYKDQC